MMKQAHFILTGEAMTEIARNLMLDDEPGKAYRLLADGLVGEQAIEAALKVLQGTHDLTGDSDVGMELVEAADTPELADYLRTLQFIYAGRIRSGGSWRRPVAQVVQWGPEDARWASARTPQGMQGTAQMRRWSKERARYFCHGGETPEVLKVDEESVYTIWEPCNELPHWMKPPRTLQAALDQALKAGRRLEERPSEGERELQALELQERLHEKADQAERELEDAEQHEEQERRRAEEWDIKIARIGREVRAQAGDDLFVLELKDGRRLDVPRAPFVRWALCRTDYRDSAPAWKNVARSGMKLSMDNPDHTDWVLGAGLTLDEAYNDIVNEAAWDAAARFQEEAQEPYPGIRAALEMLRSTIHKAAVVVDTGERTGVVGEDILVLPDSHPDRVHELEGVSGVVVEKGGKLAHFAIVTQGRGITVLRHAEACTLFQAGDRITLNPKTGRIIQED